MGGCVGQTERDVTTSPLQSPKVVWDPQETSAGMEEVCCKQTTWRRRRMAWGTGKSLRMQPSKRYPGGTDAPSRSYIAQGSCILEKTYS
jgi:hypothetical protein